jgi:hypothetical protein
MQAYEQLSSKELLAIEAKKVKSLDKLTQLSKFVVGLFIANITVYSEMRMENNASYTDYIWLGHTTHDFLKNPFLKTYKKLLSQSIGKLIVLL